VSIDALVLAAGRSTRLGAFAGDLPKPLLVLGGRSLLEWNLRWLAAAGISRVWINLHHRGAAIEAAIGNGAAFGVCVRYSREERLLGTAGAWKRLAGEWRGTSLVVYGDNLVRFDLARMQAVHRATGALATVALFDPAVHANTGIAGGRAACAADGRIVAFQEGGEARSGLVNAGVYLLEPEVAAVIPDGVSDFGRDVLPGLAGTGRLHGHVLEEGAYCLGVDTPSRFREAERMLAAGKVVPA